MKYILAFLLILPVFTFPAENKELDKALTKTTEIFNASVQAIGEGLKSTKDFAVKEIPLVIKEYLKWHFVKAIAKAVFNLSVIIMFLVGYIILYKISTKWVAIDGDNFNSYVPKVVGGIVCVLVIGLNIGNAFTNSLTAIQIYVAPRVFLLEHLKDLIK